MQKMKRALIVCAASLVCWAACADLAEYVDPFVGTSAKLFGADVTKCSYAPKGMSAERAEFLRKIAMKALQK